MLIRVAAKTDIGRVRRENQDAFGVFDDLLLFLVADGVGGHAGGRTASTLAVETIRRSVMETRDADLTPISDASGTSAAEGRRLTIALHAADDEIRTVAQRHPQLIGMCTTVAAVLLDRAQRVAAVCHVGDSRVYRLRDKRIEQLTNDHTVAQELRKAGHLALEDLATSPHRHVLTRSLGMQEELRPDVRLEACRAGDVFVLSSDGVHGAVSAEEIQAIVRGAGPDLDGACGQLINLANERGGRDNSTVIIIIICEERSSLSEPVR